MEEYEVISDIPLEFPVITGVSDRQIWYARNLREVYVLINEDRFREIGEMIAIETDQRILQNDWFDYESITMFDEYTEAEKACLFGEDAGGIIGTLKEALGRA